MKQQALFEDYPDILTIEDLRKVLNVGRSTAYRLITSGAIKHWKIGVTVQTVDNPCGALPPPRQQAAGLKDSTPAPA